MNRGEKQTELDLTGTEIIRRPGDESLLPLRLTAKRRIRRMNTSDCVCDAVEMTDSASETEVAEEAALSDQDSVSLLRDLPAFRSGSGADAVAATDSASPEISNKPESNQRRGDQKFAAGGEASSTGSAKIPSEKLLHKRNDKGETLLHRACQRSDLAQVRMLLQAGIGVNAEDNAGWTALHEACAAGDESVVEELLRAGADVGARSCDGVTPLHDAVSAGHLQVVKLLLENGSNPDDHNVGGLNAFEMAEDESMRELLRTFQTSCDGGRTARGGEPGSEDGTVSDLRPRESSDDQSRLDGGTNSAFPVQSRTGAVSAVLEDVGRRQAEMTVWPLTDLKDVGRYKGALLQTRSTLMDVLTKQRLEKDDLTHKFRVVPEYLRQRVLKSNFLSLASTQKTLLKLLQKQMQLEVSYVEAKAKISAEVQPAGTPSYHQDLLPSECYRQAGQTQSLQSKDEGDPMFPDLQSERASCCRTALRPKTASQLKSEMKVKAVVVQRGAKDSSGALCRLIQAGLLPLGGALHLTLKGKHHFASVLSDGFIMSKGKSYRAPECWLESILGHNIPVSSTYALDKVTFRNKPLSYYFLNLEAKQNPCEIQLQDETDHSSQRERSPEPVNPYQLLRRIKLIHLVNSEELLPNAIMDFYWDKLLKQNHVDFDNWESEL